MLPDSALAEEAGCFELVEACEFFRRHRRLFAGQHGVHLARGGKGAVEDEVAEVLLILECVGLGQHAAATVAEQVDFAQVESHAHGFDVFDVALDGVLARILQALGPARAALVDEDEPVRARQGQQPGQEVGVVCAGTAMQDHERRAFAEFDVVNEHAVGVDKAVLQRIDGRRGLSAKRSCAHDQDAKGETEGSNSFHGHHATAGRRESEWISCPHGPGGERRECAETSLPVVYPELSA